MSIEMSRTCQIFSSSALQLLSLSFAAMALLPQFVQGADLSGGDSGSQRLPGVLSLSCFVGCTGLAPKGLGSCGPWGLGAERVSVKRIREVRDSRIMRVGALGLRGGGADGLAGRKKVSIIGAGNVGGTTGLLVAMKGFADVVMVDIAEGLAAGKALDMKQAGSILGYSGMLTGSSDFADIRDSDIVVVTSGLPRLPGMTREDLVVKNGDIIRQVAESTAKYAPKAIVIVVTNPLDLMAYHFMKVSGFPSSRVIGMAGILDSARMVHFLAVAANCRPDDVTAMVLGGHGDSMVPLLSRATIGGIPAKQVLSDEALDEVAKRTADGGGEIVRLLGKGSAFYAPAAAIVEMIDAILLHRKLLPCSVMLSGEYGISDMFQGVPVFIGPEGLEEISEIKLDDKELTSLQKSAEENKSMLKTALGYS